MVLKSTFTSPIRSTAGCWTCRLRRKKCDEKHPICSGCTLLEIDCHFEQDRPHWMDGGRRQQERTAHVQAQVKQQAVKRRDRLYPKSVETAAKRIDNGTDANNDLSNDARGRTATGVAEEKGDNHRRRAVSETRITTKQPSRADDAVSDYAIDAGSLPGSWNFNGNLMEVSQHTQASWRQATLDTRESDDHLIMIYLDYVFPFLFPFYSPPFGVGGRGWLLYVLKSSKPAFHPAMSFSLYFFSVLLANEGGEHAACIAHNEGQLRHQIQLGLKALQQELSKLNTLSSAIDIRQGLVVLQSILKMLTFELGTGIRGNWTWHLEAAIALFQKILPESSIWSKTLNGLYAPTWAQGPWSTAQASMRFFTAYLLYVDVMSSITLETAPMLRSYHSCLIPKSATVDLNKVLLDDPLCMEEVVGLRNWLIHILGDLADLAAWKKSQLTIDTLSMDELVRRGTPLLEAINGHLIQLEVEMRQHTAVDNSLPLSMQNLSLNMKQYSGTSPVHDASTKTLHNMIWLQATLSYIYIIISGWQPNQPEIRRSVIHTKKLLLSVPNAMCLSSLVWPFFITGCLSPQEDEDTFRQLSKQHGTLQAFGTMREAMELMELVWSRRDTIDENWNLAQCLSVMGRRTLLA